jgi:hypothetical protein
LREPTKFPLELVNGLAAAFIVLCVAIALFIVFMRRRTKESSDTGDEKNLDWTADDEVDLKTVDATLADTITEVERDLSNTGLLSHVEDPSEGVALATEFL